MNQRTDTQEKGHMALPCDLLSGKFCCPEQCIRESGDAEGIWKWTHFFWPTNSFIISRRSLNLQMHVCQIQGSAANIRGFGFPVTNNSVHIFKITSASGNKMSSYESCCSPEKNRPPVGSPPVSELEVAFVAAISGSILIQYIALVAHPPISTYERKDWD